MSARFLHHNNINRLRQRKFVLLIIIISTILLLPTCSTSPFPTRPEFITETLSKRVSHLHQLNDKIHDNYNNKRDQMGYELGWEMVEDVHQVEEYINLAIYYIQTTRSANDTRTEDYLKNLSDIRNELLTIITGDEPLIKSYITTITPAMKELDRTKERINIKLNEIEILLEKL